MDQRRGGNARAHDGRLAHPRAAAGEWQEVQALRALVETKLREMRAGQEEERAYDGVGWEERTTAAWVLQVPIHVIHPDERDTSWWKVICWNSVGMQTGVYNDRTRSRSRVGL